MKTLAVRVRYQNESALKIARLLEKHRAGRGRSTIPGLESSSDHLRACELFDGFGGMLSFELEGGVDAADSFIDACNDADLGAQSGRRREPDHAARDDFALGNDGRRSARARESATGLIRLSVGLEATEDLIEDFTRVLATV